ncbi:hypothetical protein TL16_g06283 [Triparma laevis f. inornata]|uniref:C2H2-type domain-containing protein n=2 Tax=Triparma laevis TaxID=1534972 RepID=A0A9W7CAP4_9STRA|nr:hypothetical protein TL16_g06283 [Triparma laevis f. inornata]GMI03082.1 hypothetical protein TrLO_g8903 [Triparma laevis f. longispina]
MPDEDKIVAKVVTTMVYVIDGRFDDDESVASEGDVEAQNREIQVMQNKFVTQTGGVPTAMPTAMPTQKRKNPATMCGPYKKEFERDKRGWIVKYFSIEACEFKTGVLQNMKNHKVAKHGINVIWFSCGEDNCEYKSKQAGNGKKHKQNIHNIDAVWYNCDSCEYKSKEARNLKRHKHTHKKAEEVEKQKQPQQPQQSNSVPQPPMAINI